MHTPGKKKGGTVFLNMWKQPGQIQVGMLFLTSAKLTSWRACAGNKQYTSI